MTLGEHTNPDLSGTMAAIEAGGHDFVALQDQSQNYFMLVTPAAPHCSPPSALTAPQEKDMFSSYVTHDFTECADGSLSQPLVGDVLANATYNAGAVPIWYMTPPHSDNVVAGMTETRAGYTRVHPPPSGWWGGRGADAERPLAGTPPGTSDRCARRAQRECISTTRRWGATPLRCRNSTATPRTHRS